MNPFLTRATRAYTRQLIAGAFVCAAFAGSTAHAAAGGTLSVGVASPPASMDPHAADDTSDRALMTNIFDTLVARDDAGKLTPDLATSWKRIDATTWRFHLRHGVKFSNGNDFTWQDVKYTLARLRNPEVSEYLNFGSLIQSVKPVKGDPWTIDIKTPHSVPFLVQFLPNIFIMDKESSASRSEGEIGLHPIGTGPYVLSKWIKGSYLKLAANDHYWGDKPSIAHVTIRPITETSTRMAAIASGQVDILQGVPVSLSRVIARNPNVNIVSRPGRRSIFLALGNKKGTPTADIRVRRAMYMAIDEKAIIAKLLFGHGTPASQLSDPLVAGYNPQIKRLPYDPEKAKQLLKEAGYPNGFSITLTGPNDRYVEDKQIEATIAGQLAKIGIQVHVNAEPKAVFFPQVAQNKLDFYLIGWLDGGHDFGRTFDKLLHTVDTKAGYGGLNGTSYSDPALDALSEKAASTVDIDKRTDILRQLETQAMKQIAIIPLHYQENDYAVRKDRDIHFVPRPDTYLVFKNMTIGAS